jgi:hypothetical protein
MCKFYKKKNNKQATHILCTRHLKENVSEILSKIVDAGGLLNAKGLVVYNELEAELQQALKCFTIPPAQTAAKA